MQIINGVVLPCSLYHRTRRAYDLLELTTTQKITVRAFCPIDCIVETYANQYVRY